MKKATLLGPRGGPRRPKIALRRPQDILEEVFFRYRKMSSIWVRLDAVLVPFWLPLGTPYWKPQLIKKFNLKSQDRRKRIQEALKGTRESPRGTQKTPESTQECTREHLKVSQEHQKSTQKAAKRAKRPKRADRMLWRTQKALSVFAVHVWSRGLRITGGDNIHQRPVTEDQNGKACTAFDGSRFQAKSDSDQ